MAKRWWIIKYLLMQESEEEIQFLRSICEELRLKKLSGWLD